MKEEMHRGYLGSYFCTHTVGEDAGLIEPRETSPNALKMCRWGAYGMSNLVNRNHRGRGCLFADAKGRRRRGPVPLVGEEHRRKRATRRISDLQNNGQEASDEMQNFAGLN